MIDSNNSYQTWSPLLWWKRYITLYKKWYIFIFLGVHLHEYYVSAYHCGSFLNMGIFLHFFAKPTLNLRQG